MVMDMAAYIDGRDWKRWQNFAAITHHLRQRSLPEVGDGVSSRRSVLLGVIGDFFIVCAVGFVFLVETQHLLNLGAQGHEGAVGDVNAEQT